MAQSGTDSNNESRLLYQQLRQVAARGDAAAIRALIAQATLGGYLNNDHLSTGLRFAAKHGHPAAVRGLLEAGADTEVDGNKHYPALFLAVSQQRLTPGHCDVATILLEGNYMKCPANIDWRDDKGRTVAMTAAWKGHLEALKILFKNGANANARDNELRTVLHNLAADPFCRWNDQIIEFILSTDIDIDIQDNQDRTALHWAASTGKASLIRMLLAKAARTKSKQIPTGFTVARDKTPLHLACSARPPNAAAVKYLLDYGSDPSARSDGNWSCLHTSVQTQGSVEIVEILLKASPSLLNARTSNGMTALHYAAQAGQIDVVTFLLAQPGIIMDYKDSFHSTPLLRAAQEGKKEIVELLAPFNNADRLSEHAVKACKGFEASIYDFRPGSGGHQNYGSKHTVFDTLYGKDGRTGKAMISTRVAEVKKRRGSRSDNTAETWKPFRWLHLPSNNLAWAETAVAKAFLEAESLDIEGFKAMQRSFSQQHRGHLVHSHYMRPLCKRSVKPEREILPSSFHLQVDDSSRLVSPIDISSDKNFDAIGTEQKSLSGSNIVFFCPYLHFETATGLEKMKEIMRDLTCNDSKELKRELSSDESLFSAYLSNKDLQPRRTLGQSYLSGIDTEKRDETQVVRNFCRRYKKEDKIFMVDQLWIWILGPSLIITSFPHRWDQPKNAPLNVLEGIIEDMNSKTRPPVRSVHDLALLITGRCAGTFDRHRPEDDDYQFLDMFESSIGTVNDKEAKLFEDFYSASAEVHNLLDLDQRSTQHSVSSTNDRYTKLVNKFLDIDEEVTLLKEIKNIRDELNMLARVLHEQGTNIPKLGKAISEDHQSEAQLRETKRKVNEQKGLIEVHLKELERMSKLSGAIEKSLLSLLELKQRQASTFETRFTRDQARGTIRQGQIILIFTMTTIIFMPLSFIASFFAIDFTEFSRSPNGTLSIGYVSKYMFGIGLGISLFLICAAFSINPIGARATGVKSSRSSFMGIWRSSTGEQRGGPASGTGDSGLARLMHNGRKSIEARKEGLGLTDSSPPETDHGLFGPSHRNTYRDLEYG